MRGVIAVAAVLMLGAPTVSHAGAGHLLDGPAGQSGTPGKLLTAPTPVSAVDPGLRVTLEILGGATGGLIGALAWPVGLLLGGSLAIVVALPLLLGIAGSQIFAAIGGVDTGRTRPGAILGGIAGAGGALLCTLLLFHGLDILLMLPLLAAGGTLVGVVTGSEIAFATTEPRPAVALPGGHVGPAVSWTF